MNEKACVALLEEFHQLKELRLDWTRLSCLASAVYPKEKASGVRERTLVTFNCGSLETTVGVVCGKRSSILSSK